MKIYTVMGSTGEYSDRDEWSVVSYVNKKMAEKHVVEATKRADEWEATRPSQSDYAPSGWSEYDPEFTMDYTGTHYFIVETELVEGDELWQVETI